MYHVGNQCMICLKKFDYPSKLSRHLLVHMGIKGRYCCPVCSKRFGAPSKLQRHSLVHTGQRSYQCPTCPKTFRQKAHLKVHQSTWDRHLLFKD
uniref:C2H2-type domain-containing protein n=1 Tax=Oncorhynchus mykiss TaxID=8022 RepID=A0A8K9UGR8_ONCMY